MKSIKKYSYLFCIFSMLLFFGYYRDFVFKNINALLKARDYDMEYRLPGSLHFMENYTYDTLLNIKWVLTFLFTAIYLAISMITIQLLFKNKKYSYITLAVYAAITAISALFILTGYILQNISETMYEFARYLMGMAQSPIILMILLPAFKLSEKNTADIDIPND